jgi:hypothetical protein
MFHHVGHREKLRIYEYDEKEKNITKYATFSAIFIISQSIVPV